MKKQIEVVLLPTEDKSYIALAWNKLVCGIPRMFSKTRDYTPQHLYITVSQDVELIKKGDWFYNIKSSNIFKNDSGETIPKSDTEFKIIATTDKSLKQIIKNHNDFDSIYELPQPTQEFLKEFVANPDGKWEVEYKDCSYKTCGKGCDSQMCRERHIVLKLNQDNTINITSKEEKIFSTTDLLGNQDSSLDHFLLHSTEYSQEDREVIMDAVYNWIKENLK